MRAALVLLSVCLLASAKSPLFKKSYWQKGLMDSSSVDTEMATSVHESLRDGGLPVPPAIVRRSAPSQEDLCLPLTCIARDETCPPPFGNKPCQSAYFTCLFSTLTLGEGGIEGINETAACDCVDVYYTCIDDSTGIYAPQYYSLCSFVYLNIIPQWGLNATCDSCRAPAPSSTSKACQFGYYCNNDTNVCTNPVTEGGDCIYEVNDDGENEYGHSQCGRDADEGGLLGNNPYACINSTCALVTPFRMHNDDCASDEECFSGNCDGTTCVGLAGGAACTVGEECQFNFYCPNATKVCTPKITQGAACVINSGIGRSENDDEPFEESNDACEVGLICLTTNNTCQPAFTSPLGTSCTDNDECNWGTACTPSGCAVPPATPTSCDIADGVEDNPACTSVGGNCECNIFGDGGFICNPDDLTLAANCDVLFEPVIECQTTNECKDVSGEAGSCFMKNCDEEYKCVWSCFEDALSDTFGNCFDYAVASPGMCTIVNVTSSTGGTTTTTSGASSTSSTTGATGATGTGTTTGATGTGTTTEASTTAASSASSLKVVVGVLAVALVSAQL